MSNILVIEDESIIRQALARLLIREGFHVTEAEAVKDGVTALNDGPFDLVISDLRLPDGTGTDVIEHAGNTPVLIMTSYASVKSAVESMKKGAVDYIAKPFDHDEMVLSVRRIVKQTRLERQNTALKSEIERSYPVSGMIGDCKAMVGVFERIGKVAPTNATVLILGESGTGKELVARALHENSTRYDGPLISVNCAAIPGTLVESELFGHEKGSFTGAVGARTGLVEAADGGTLFLDEIGELPLEAQARLLRVLQEGEIRRVGSARQRRVDIRLIAATHRDLPALVQNGGFREDLFFRLNVMEVSLPPLRDRGPDIQRLARELLKKSCQRLHKPTPAFTEHALKAIKEYAWPGNVRELENAIERAVILCDNEIDAQLLNLRAPTTPATDTGKGDAPNMSMEDYFRHFVTTHQDQLTETQLAERLGISRKALWERRQRLGLLRLKQGAEGG